MRPVSREAVENAIAAQRAVWEAFLAGQSIPHQLATACMRSMCDLEAEAGIDRPAPMSNDMADAPADNERIKA